MKTVTFNLRDGKWEKLLEEAITRETILTDLKNIGIPKNRIYAHINSRWVTAWVHEHELTRILLTCNPLPHVYKAEI